MSRAKLPPFSSVPTPLPAWIRSLAWLLPALALGLPGPITHATQAVVVLDTGKPLAPDASPVERAAWAPVPSDLLKLEADPAKASSDPGYYGREYRFQGDAVVENARLTAVFARRRGRLVLHAKETASTLTSAPSVPGQGPLGRPVAECLLVPPTDDPSVPAPVIVRFDLVRHGADEVMLGVVTADPGRRARGETVTLFVFGRDEIVEIRPPASSRGLRFQTSLAYGIVPGFIGDDLVFSASGDEEVSRFRPPAEGLFVGLGGTGSEQLVLAWDRASGQSLNLQLAPAGGGAGDRRIVAIDLEHAGRGVFLAPQTAPGLWHRRAVTARNLETDLRLDWRPPFPARWKTLLHEGDVKTTFAFRDGRGQIWRGVPGSYQYPAWFENGAAFLRFGKKVPPRDEALVYALEPQSTPAPILTPVDVLKSALGRSAADALLDRAGRQLRTHHRRGGEGIRRACTCGCTEAIQSVFEAGQEVERRGFVKDALDDMIFFVARHVERIGEYQVFAEDLLRFLKTTTSSRPELAEYLEGLAAIAGQIPQECTVQQENMKSPGHAHDLAQRTLALTQRQDASNLTNYLGLLKAWRDMGGAQDYVVAQCHTVTRRLFQEAGYGAATHPQPSALAVAQEVRQRCRAVLRNPDGYEIWAEY